MNVDNILKTLETVSALRQSNKDLQDRYNAKCRELALAEQTIKRLSGQEQVGRSPEKDIVNTLVNHSRGLTGTDLLVVTSSGELYKVTGTKNNPTKHFIARLFKVSGNREIAVNNSTELFRSRSFSNTISNTDEEYDSWKSRRLLSKGKMSRRSGSGKTRVTAHDGLVIFAEWLKEIFG